MIKCSFSCFISFFSNTGLRRKVIEHKGWLLWTSRSPCVTPHFYDIRVNDKKMPRISDVHRDSYTDSILSLSEGLIILFVASSVLVLGALCKYLGKLCRKLWKKPRWKRKSKKRHSKRAEQRKGSAPVKRSGSFRSGEGVVMSPQFTIPSSRSCMIQQPYPDLSQGRTGKTTADKRLS